MAVAANGKVQYSNRWLDQHAKPRTGMTDEEFEAFMADSQSETQPTVEKNPNPTNKPTNKPTH